MPLDKAVADGSSDSSPIAEENAQTREERNSGISHGNYAETSPKLLKVKRAKET